jgi:hypothetical protein
LDIIFIGIQSGDFSPDRGISNRRFLTRMKTPGMNA